MNHPFRTPRPGAHSAPRVSHRSRLFPLSALLLTALCLLFGAAAQADLPTLSINDVAVTEGDSGSTDATFTVGLSAPSASTVTVDANLSDGTATAPTDYTVNLAQGKTATQSTTLVNPPFEVGPEKAVDGNTDGNLSNTSSNSVTHTDQENQPWWQVDLGSVQDIGDIKVWNRTDSYGERLSDFYVLVSDLPFASNDLTTTLADSNVMNTHITTQPAPSVEVPINRTGRYIRVQLSNNDYLSLAEVQVFASQAAQVPATTTTVTFAPGETTKLISVPVLGDTLDDEDYETFLVNLSNPTNATIADSQGIGTITDDDPTPTLSIDDVTVAEGDSGSTNAAFAVSLSAPSARTVTVHAKLADGTASAGSDYTVNLAQGKSATQSSTIVNPPFQVGPGKAVDGNVDGNLTNTPANSVTHTDNETEPWWEVDLGCSKSIGDIKVWNRTDSNGERLSDFYVFVSDLPFASNDVTTTQADSNVMSTHVTAQPAPSVEIPINRTGQYVRVQLTGTDFLSLAEVQVFASQAAQVPTTKTTLTFAPGETTKLISVPVRGDTDYELDETYFVNLCYAVNATIADGQGLGTITNDDIDPAQTGPAFVVNSTDDHDDGVCGTTDCTLREAITAANDYNSANANVGATITFASPLFDTPQTITLDGTALPNIASDITITGSTAGVTINGANTSRIITINVGQVAFVDLTFTGANVSGSGGGAFYNNSGTLSVTGCTFYGNTADTGSAFSNSGTVTLTNCTVFGNNATTSDGGAINSEGTLTLNNCTIASNTAVSGVSGISNIGTLNIGNTILANTGGNILNGGTVTSNGYNLSSDAADGDGTTGPGGLLNSTGDIRNTDPLLDTLADNGGPTQTIALLTASPAINAGDTTLTVDQRGVTRPQGTRDDIGAYEFDAFSESLIVTTIMDEDNGTSDPAFGTGTSLRETIGYANSNADASVITFACPLFDTAQTITLGGTELPIINTDVTITGPAAGVTVDGDNASRVFFIATGVTASFSGLTVTGGNGVGPAFSGEGGGIDNRGTLTITNSHITGNSCGGSGMGGGIFNNGTLTLTNSSVTDNSSGLLGGGIASIGTLTITGSTVSNNTNTYTGGGGVGGGIESYGNTDITNSTISGNHADSGTANNAGGLWFAGGSVTITNSTIANNTAAGTDSAGGLVFDGTYSGMVTVSNTIIAGNTGTSGANPDVSSINGGSFTSGGYNLIGDDTGSTGFINGTNSDQVGTTGTPIDAKLGTLADNGGPTQTMALLAGSPAINKGNDASAPATDQRGVARPQGLHTDIGAFEAFLLKISDVTVVEGDTGAKGATFTVTLSSASSQTVTVDYATADGTAKAPGDYTTKTGTLTFAPSETSKTVTVAVLGDTLSESNENFKVDLTNPTNAGIGDSQGLGTITDNDAEPNLRINDVTVVEGDSGAKGATFTVTLSKASGRTVSVNYATTDDSAKAPGDYTTKTGTLTFAPGETSKTLTVPVLGDTVDERDETYFVNLSSALHAGIGDNQGVGTITDNDPAPTLSINDVTVTEGDTGAKGATFTVTLSKASERTVSVNYATADGSATAPGDYTTKTGTLTFLPGQTSRTFVVPVMGDTVVEGTESYLVNLSSPINATVADGLGAGTINDNDVAPAVMAAPSSDSSSDDSQ